MPRYTVDVKAFINITVEAENEQQARDAANTYVESSLSPCEMEIDGWNEAQAEEEWPGGKIISTPGFSVDGISEVEDADAPDCA